MHPSLQIVHFYDSLHCVRLNEVNSDGTGWRDQLGYHFVCEAALRELIRGQKHASALRNEDEKPLHYEQEIRVSGIGSRVWEASRNLIRLTALH